MIDQQLIYTTCSANLTRKLFFAQSPPPGEGGFQKKWVGVYGPLSKTLILVMTKLCDFPYPMYDLTKNSIPYLWPLRLAQVL